MNKKVQFNDESPPDQKVDLEAFRHEQTVKRWKARNKRKVSKVIYLSDYLPENNYAERPNRTVTTTTTSGKSGKVLLSMGSQYEKTFIKKRGGGIHKADKKLKGVTQASKQSGQSKKVNFKVKASDSTVPFNHYARHTKLKRSIMASREAALRDLLSADTETPQKEQLWYLLLLSEKMKRIYIRVDACMRQRRFSQVKHLKHQIRHVRYHIRRITGKESFRLTEAQKKKVALLQEAFCKSLQESEKGDNEDADWVAVEGDEEGVSAFFAKFDPTLVELAIVVANRSLPPNNGVKTQIDQRTGRYPVVLSEEDLQQFHQHCQYDNLPATKAFCLSDPFAPKAAAAGAKGKTHAPPPPLFVAPYCRNIVTDLLDDLAFTTLQKLYQEQKKLKDKQPLQFKSRQRYVVGLQETIKCLRAKQIKLVLLAADMEAFSPPQLTQEEPPPKEELVANSPSAGGQQRRKFQSLAEAIEMVQLLCGEEVDVPCVVCMSRQRLSYALYAKQSKIGCVGIMHAEQNNEWVKALKLCATAMLSALKSRLE